MHNLINAYSFGFWINIHNAIIEVASKFRTYNMGISLSREMCAAFHILQVIHLYLYSAQN